MNVIVAQIMAATPMPTPTPAFAPALKPDEECKGFGSCFSAGNVDVGDALPDPVEEGEVDGSEADVGTELLWAACTFTEGMAEAPGIVYPA